jgi:hypothetical protein
VKGVEAEGGEAAEDEEEANIKENARESNNITLSCLIEKIDMKCCTKNNNSFEEPQYHCCYSFAFQAVEGK